MVNRPTKTEPFAPAALAELAARHQPAFAALHRVEQQLNNRFYGVAHQVRALVLALLSGEPLLFVGPPGTAKSRLIRALCRYLGVTPDAAADEAAPGYFEYLLTPFTEPGELFGFWDVQALKEGRMKRLDDGMLQRSEVAFLDEVFNGSSAILNSLLAILHERRFHDRGRLVEARTEHIFAATNRVPDSAELRALYDRFTLRVGIANVSDHGTVAGTEGLAGRLAGLLTVGWRETFAEPDVQREGAELLAGLRGFRADVRAMTRSGALAPRPEEARFFQDLAAQVDTATRHQLSAMSNRRLVKLLYVMLVHRLYRAAAEPAEPGGPGFWADELTLCRDYFLDDQDGSERAREQSAQVLGKMARFRFHGPYAAAVAAPSRAG